MGNSFCYGSCGHTYSIVSSGLKRDFSKSFCTREAANECMYKTLAKNHLSVAKVYDDKHDKTYKCGDGVTFYIQRS